MIQHNQSTGINSVSDDMRTLLRPVNRQERRDFLDIDVRPNKFHSESLVDASIDTVNINNSSIIKTATSLSGINYPKKRPDLPKQSRSQVLKRTHSKKSFAAVHPIKHHRPIRQFFYFAALLLFISTCTALVLYIYSISGKTQYPIEVKPPDSKKILILENSFY